LNNKELIEEEIIVKKEPVVIKEENEIKASTILDNHNQSPGLLVTKTPVIGTLSNPVILSTSTVVTAPSPPIPIQSENPLLLQLGLVGDYDDENQETTKNELESIKKEHNHEQQEGLELKINAFIVQLEQMIGEKLRNDCKAIDKFSKEEIEWVELEVRGMTETELKEYILTCVSDLRKYWTRLKEKEVIEDEKILDDMKMEFERQFKEWKVSELLDKHFLLKINAYKQTLDKLEEKNKKNQMKAEAKPIIPLPLNWVSRQDITGRTYYVNTVTGASRWSPPPLDGSADKVIPAATVPAAPIEDMEIDNQVELEQTQEKDNKIQKKKVKAVTGVSIGKKRKMVSLIKKWKQTSKDENEDEEDSNDLEPVSHKKQEINVGGITFQAASTNRKINKSLHGVK